MNRLFCLLGPVLLVLGCDKPSPPPEPALYTPPPRLKPEEAGLTRLANGNYFLMAAPGATLQYDPTLKDPLTALAACSQWLVGCFSPNERTLDACVEAVPACQTPSPWEEAAPCCPSACKDQYRQQRQGTADAFAALDAVLFVDGSCLPGVNALLGKP
ncbi:MAG: hypothetical protein Q8L48_10275 [Archangium sp.]|nr:hypothetical protein [Archangium sp.]